MDLFGQCAIAGLRLAEDVIGPDAERALIARIDMADLAPFRFQGWLGKRLTKSFGWAYDFDGGRFAETEAIPAWLLPARDIASAATGLNPEILVQALLIRYDPGAGIGWHKDRPVFAHVVGMSLGASVAMRFRRRVTKGFERHAVPLAPRSVYHLSGEARHEWEHSIAPIDAPRWSITFRSLAG